MSNGFLSVVQIQIKRIRFDFVKKKIFIMLSPFIFTAMILSYAVLGAKNNAYTMKWDHITLENFDTSLVNVTGNIGFVNRTLKALSVVAQFNSWIPDGCTIQMFCDKWINNKFHRYSALQFTETCNGILKWDWFDLQGLFKSFDPPLKDRWLNVTYRLNNYVLDANNYSPLIPTGYYKAELSMYKDKKKSDKFLMMEWYLHLIPIQRKG